ncbi:isochorismatase family protein [Rhodoblastus acidophilus]|uniref:Isochorismatase family protein n=1 Tax=Candidatus Rhodoblastus alkanivorans TaxID=2954117 RepID=A0ABS9Z140_9HYPH|nr:isochorismatase family protein [Candidatus Rhodoblastus alkanivorans]MCI4681333.1 isochorismatase family protein [Candidatus Rhodoblastus alkanivorans]MDI4642380.1 isochorismatase family protein [Rhodoblastus acidophilus]
MLTPGPDSSLLLLIDFQARLAPAMDGAQAAIANARRLAEGARILGVETLVTEQNPEKLGPTVPELAEYAAAPVAKMTFDATAASNFPKEKLESRAIVVAGFETHVCVSQSVLALLAEGQLVLVAADAVGSRRAENRETALRRMERFGAQIVTTEMILFEWLGSADHPRFRDISRLVK